MFFRLKPGAYPGYAEAHHRLWPAMREVLDEAGLQNYSIWYRDDRLFAYYEVENAAEAEVCLQNSPVYRDWRRYMEDYVYADPETGEKEWLMTMVFYHPGREN